MYNKKRFEDSRFEVVSDSLSNLWTNERRLATFFLGMQSCSKAVELFSCLSENINTFENGTVLELLKTTAVVC